MHARTLISGISLGTMVCALMSTAPSVADEIQIEKTRSVTSTSSIPTAATSMERDPIVALAHRLDAIRDQIDLGVQKGMLNYSDADVLRSQASQIGTDLNGLRGQPSTQSQKDDIEGRVNALNIALSDAMNKSHTATTNSGNQ